MNSLFRKLLFGDTAIKEFSTITVNDQIKESVILETGNQTIDVSENQFLLCLEPIIFGVWLTNDIILSSDSLKSFAMLFTSGIKHQVFTRITLNLFDKIEDDKGCLYLLRQIGSKINHINTVKTSLMFSRYYKKPGFSFEQFKAMVAAYSYPRRVRIISFSDGDYYNIFPMDLLGDIYAYNRYVFGLRNTNTTLTRIIETKKLVVAEVSYQHKQTIYKLGSHHSIAPPRKELLPFEVIRSKSFGFYLPEWTISYKEVIITKTMNLGSHTLLWAEVQAQCNLKPSTGHLYHIHYLLYLYLNKKNRAYISV